VNGKKLINEAKDNAKIEQVIYHEAKVLVDAWLDEGFPPKLLQYMQSLKAARGAKPKL
jgi:hypothetical protein